MEHVLELKRAQHRRYLQEQEREELCYRQLLRQMSEHMRDQEQRPGRLKEVEGESRIKY